MSAFNQLACLPGFFGIGANLIDNTGQLLKRNELDTPSRQPASLAMRRLYSRVAPKNAGRRLIGPEAEARPRFRS